MICSSTEQYQCVENMKGNLNSRRKKKRKNAMEKEKEEYVCLNC